MQWTHSDDTKPGPQARGDIKGNFRRFRCALIQSIMRALVGSGTPEGQDSLQELFL